ncbi:hypothetical protein GCM10028868_06460 [Virgibacillus kimchii]
MKNGEYQYHHIKSKLVHINKQRNGLQLASLKFVSVTHDIRQQIIHYCFDKQREARKKEWQSF